MAETPDVLKHLLITSKGLDVTSQLGMGNRSQGVRVIVQAILSEFREGRTEAFRHASRLAVLTIPKSRLTMEPPSPESRDWSRTTAWISRADADLIESNISVADLKLSDWLRGAVLGATGEAPTCPVKCD